MEPKDTFLRLRFKNSLYNLYNFQIKNGFFLCQLEQYSLDLELLIYYTFECNDKTNLDHRLANTAAYNSSLGFEIGLSGAMINET